MSIEDGAAESATPIFHKNFDEPDGDVTFVSSDNVAFRLRSKYLPANALGSPLTNDIANPKTLEEPTAILEILFPFLYPRRCPSVVGLEFKVLIQLAKAAEKYKIFSAAGVCEHPLLSHAALFPAEILSFGVKYDYPELANQAAIHLSRVQRPLDEILDEIPEESRIAWVRYDQAWKWPFNQGRKLLKAKLQCKTCIELLSGWLREIEEMSIDGLNNQEGVSEQWKLAIRACRDQYHGLYGSEGHISWGLQVLQALLKFVKQISTFTEYMSTRDATAVDVKRLMQIPDFQVESEPEYASLKYIPTATQYIPKRRLP